MAGWLSGYGGGLQILYSRVRFSPLPPIDVHTTNILLSPAKHHAHTSDKIVIASLPLTMAKQTALFAPLAGIAQLVERDLAKVEVTGSSPVTRSKLKREDYSSPFFYMVVNGRVAQWLRRRTANPLFASSILAPASNLSSKDFQIMTCTIKPQCYRHSIVGLSVVPAKKHKTLANSREYNDRPFGFLPHIFQKSFYSKPKAYAFCR